MAGMRQPASLFRSLRPILAAGTLALASGLSLAGTAPDPVTVPEGGIESLPLDERLALSARWDLAYYLFQLQEYAAAAEEFEKILRVIPGEPTLLALVGSCHSMSGRWQEGEASLLKAHARSPGDADVNGLLGQFYLSQGKGMRGAFFLEHALKAAPELAELRTNLADAYLAAGQHARAQVHLETLLKERGGVEFGDPGLDHAYARCLVQSGGFREAMPFALRAHRSQPGNPAFARTLGLALFGANRFGEAARLLAAGRGFSAGAEGDTELHLRLGEALFQDRRWDAAETAWLQGITRAPAAYPIYSRLIDFYLGTAKPSQAFRVAAYAASENPGHPGNLLLEVRLSRKLADHAAARKALQRLKRQACGSMAEDALWEEAQLEYETGRFTACGKILDRLQARKRGKGEGFARLGEVHRLRSKLAAADERAAGNLYSRASR